MWVKMTVNKLYKAQDDFKLVFISNAWNRQVWKVSLKTVGLRSRPRGHRWRCLEMITHSSAFASWLVLISRDSTTSGECKTLLENLLSGTVPSRSPLRKRNPRLSFSPWLFLVQSIFWKWTDCVPSPWPCTSPVHVNGGRCALIRSYWKSF